MLLLTDEAAWKSGEEGPKELQKEGHTPQQGSQTLGQEPRVSARQAAVTNITQRVRLSTGTHRPVVLRVEVQIRGAHKVVPPPQDCGCALAAVTLGSRTSVPVSRHSGAVLPSLGSLSFRLLPGALTVSEFLLLVKDSRHLH